VKKLADDKLGIIIGGFMLILVAVIFTDVIGDSVWGTNNRESEIDEVITIAAGAAQLASDDIYSITNIENSTDQWTGDGISFPPADGSTWNVTVAGVVTTNLTGAWNITYVFNPDEYVKSATSRTLLSLIPIFFVLAVLMFGVGMFMKMRKGAI